MRLILALLLVGCSRAPQAFVGKCFKPFIYNGEVVRVLECTNKEFYEAGSNFCIIERKRQSLFGNKYVDQSTVFTNSLENSIQVSCTEY